MCLSDCPLSVDFDSVIVDDGSIVGDSFPRMCVNPETDAVRGRFQCGPCLLSSNTKSGVISLEKTGWASGMTAVILVHQEWSIEFGSFTLETPGLVCVH